MNSQLIIVDGHSSVGKSSISKSVYQQINRSHPAYWLHEECENHPIRSGEFRFGALDTAMGMEQNRIGMLEKWKAFRDSIVASGKMCVTEGCFLHAYDRYFIHGPWSSTEINAYCAQVLDVIKNLNPIIVLLYRPDLRKSLEKAFIARGQWWKDLILRRDDLHVYFKDHVYVDENSMFDAVTFEQSRIMEMFESLDCSKIKIDTSEEKWEQYTREIVQYSGLQYQKDDPRRCEMSPYPGAYRWQNGTENDDWIIQYDDANDCLYTTLFWPYMPMRRVKEDVFELISFPVELRFCDGADGMKFTVHGNYDWEYNEQVFIKVPTEKQHAAA